HVPQATLEQNFDRERQLVELGHAGLFESAQPKDGGLAGFRGKSRSRSEWIMVGGVDHRLCPMILCAVRGDGRWEDDKETRRQGDKVKAREGRQSPIQLSPPRLVAPSPCRL